VHTGRPDSELLPPPLLEALTDVTHAVLMPLLNESRTVALLLVCRGSASGFDAFDLETLAMLGNVAALALRNADLLSHAQEAVRAKSTFLNMAAHELRTPLSVVNGYVSMLNEGVLGDVPARWERPLEVIVEKSAELGSLIEDILVAARIEGGGMVAQRRTIDLRGVTAEAVERARGRVSLLNARIESVLPDGEVRVHADPLQLARILDNLINNALTYAHREPHVTVEVEGGEQPRVRVRDNGVGIAEDKREEVFQRFSRLQDTLLPQRSGTGLGLPLARDLAERNGGSLRLVQSVPGEGSVFELALPAASMEIRGRAQHRAELAQRS
jgi:signal transduction histidine kinase